MTTRRFQTNEVGRCTALLPAFELAFAQGDRKPLAIIEIGASAGLNLLWDHFGYDYGTAGQAGDPHSPVQLYCMMRGDLFPPIPAHMPQVAQRIGIDLHPIDIQDEGAIRWLQAQLWPEQQDRAQLQAQAIQLARQNPPTLVAGNALDVLPGVLGDVPQWLTLCIYHSYTLNQTPQPIRDQILALIADFARTRDLFRISFEWYGGQDQAQLEFFTYRQGNIHGELLAYCESRGRWIERSQRT